MSGFASVADVLRGLTRVAKWGDGLKRYEVVRRWAETVGPAVAARTDPVEIKGRTLYVEVRDPIWLQQLVFMRESIRCALNDAVGREEVERLYFRLAETGRRESGAPSEAANPRWEESRRRHLAERAPEWDANRDALETIGDEEVRKALEHLMKRAGGLRP